MAKLLHESRKASRKPFVLGRKSFARISAVEGIRLSPDMEEMFAEFDRKGLSASERRRIIARKYGRAR